VNVGGVAIGDFAEVSAKAQNLFISQCSYVADVRANGVVTVSFLNLSAAPQQPPIGIFNIRVIPQ
jgi:hypothetical protein